MDSGGVELSGAVDYTPDKEPVEKKKTVESVEKIATEDIHFRASDIEKKDNKELFEKPADKKRRERDEKRRINAEAKQILRDAKKKKKVSGASESVQQAEKALKDEQGRIAANQRAEKAGKFFRVFFGGKRKIVTLSIIGVLVVGGLLSYLFVIAPAIERGRQDELRRLDLEAEEYAFNFQSKIYNYNIAGDGAYKDGKDEKRAIKEFEKEIENASREKKIYLYISCGYLVRDLNRPEIDREHEEDPDYVIEWDEEAIRRAVSMVEAAKDLLETDTEKSAYYEALDSIYSGYDDEKANEYSELKKQADNNLCKQYVEECK